MHIKSIYEIINKLIPPSLKVDKNIQDTLIRLESLSACVIVRDAYKSRILSKIPKKLHPVIWKSYLRNEYYINRDFSSDPKLSGLMELLQHWPDDAFILKDIMPSSPAKLSWFPNSWDGTIKLCPFYQNEFYFNKFYKCVTYCILENFILNKSQKNGIPHNDSYKIRKLDISGTIIINVSKLSKIIKSYGNLFGDDVDKLEIILDLDCDADTGEEQLSDFELMTLASSLKMSLASSYTNSEYSIIKCGHLTIYTSQCTKTAIQMIENSVIEGTKSIFIGIEFDADITNVDTYVSELVHGMYKSLSDQINILFFGYHAEGSLHSEGIQHELKSISFLQYFKNLERLNLTECDLNGELDPLLYLEKGLHYLSLHSCQLEDSDLEVLLRSPHKTTLFELNLCYNFFFGKNDTTLIKLCQELTNVIVLELSGCSLEERNVKNLRFLCDSLKSLPNLAYLNLSGNVFVVDNVTSYMISLSASPSLRHVEIELFEERSEKNKEATKTFSSHINNIVNKDRSELLYVELGIQECYGPSLGGN